MNGSRSWGNAVRLILASTAVWMVAGCLPEQKVVWSPQGTHAAVLGSGGLWLASADGALDAVVEPTKDDGTGVIGGVAWSRDGRTLWLVRAVKARKWSAVEGRLGPDERDVVVALSETVPGMIRAALAGQRMVKRGGGPAGEGPLEESEIGPWMLAALMLAYEREPERVGLMLNQLLDDGKADNGADSGFDRLDYTLYELCRVSIADAEAPTVEVVATGLCQPTRLAVAPAGAERLAYMRAAGRTTMPQVRVRDAAGGCERVVAVGRELAMAWVPDGGALVVARTDGGETAGAAVQRVSLVDGSVQDLGRVCFAGQPRLAVLPDGSVLCSSREVNLPAAAAAAVPPAVLVVLSASGGAPRPVALADGVALASTQWFVPSPDGARVALMEESSLRVVVVELATGRTTVVADRGDAWQSLAVPAWRGPQELTFAGLADDGKPACFLWSAESGRSRRFDRGWPTAAMAGWMRERENDVR